MNTAPMDCGPTSGTHLYHPLPNLLELSAMEILECYRSSQLADLTRTLGKVREHSSSLVGSIDLLRRYLAVHPTKGFDRRLDVDTVERLIRNVHDHVMSHPVWVHPFFVRVAEGDVTLEQLRTFARHYFNQVKNTRQCVALALGRFHTLMDRSEGELNNALAELTQVVLARLLADEYGTGSPEAAEKGQPRDRSEMTPSVCIEELFSPVTHPGLYRRFLDALAIPAESHDVPMLHGVADNVLVQRILAGDAAYQELEALASVGLGMEWGVPAFFSMIMAGIQKLARRDGLQLDSRSMEIWSSHVRQDVEHAIAVMVVTSFYVAEQADITKIEGATNILMAFRYNMMTDIYTEVFGGACPRIDEIDLAPRHFLHDRRIELLLGTARLRVRPDAVRDYGDYRSREAGNIRQGVDARPR